MPPLLPDPSLLPVPDTPYASLAARAAAPLTTPALPRLLLWYGEDFGHSLPQRLMRLRGMLKGGDSGAWAAGAVGAEGAAGATGAAGAAGEEVCHVGGRRYAHAVLTGLLRAYGAAAEGAGAIQAANEAEEAVFEKTVDELQIPLNENKKKAEDELERRKIRFALDRTGGRGGGITVTDEDDGNIIGKGGGGTVGANGTIPEIIDAVVEAMSLGG